MTRSTIDLIAEIQCPGCVAGPEPTTCRSFKPIENYGVRCEGHVPGTSAMGPFGVVNFALGLPKGFNRRANGETIRIWPTGYPDWDHLNVPVWYLLADDMHLLYVRTFVPRLAEHYVDVIDSGRFDARSEILNDWPSAKNVGNFYDDID